MKVVNRLKALQLSYLPNPLSSIPRNAPPAMALYVKDNMSKFGGNPKERMTALGTAFTNDVDARASYARKAEEQKNSALAEKDRILKNLTYGDRLIIERRRILGEKVKAKKADFLKKAPTAVAILVQERSSIEIGKLREMSGMDQEAQVTKFGIISKQYLNMRDDEKEIYKQKALHAKEAKELELQKLKEDHAEEFHSAATLIQEAKIMARTAIRSEAAALKSEAREKLKMKVASAKLKAKEGKMKIKESKAAANLKAKEKTKMAKTLKKKAKTAHLK